MVEALDQIDKASQKIDNRLQVVDGYHIFEGSMAIFKCRTLPRWNGPQWAR